MTSLCLPFRHQWVTTMLSKPVEVISNRQEQPWLDVIEDKNVKVQITPDNAPTWVEFTFAQQTHLRSIELPPVELLMKRRNFDPDARVRLEAFVDGSWLETSTRVIPRGTGRTASTNSRWLWHSRMSRRVVSD